MFSFDRTLHIVTLVMCVVTLATSLAALMPQLKQGLAILRDMFGWGLILALVGIVAWNGWSKLLRMERNREAAQPSSATTLPAPRTEPDAATTPWVDPNRREPLPRRTEISANRSI